MLLDSPRKPHVRYTVDQLKHDYCWQTSVSEGLLSSTSGVKKVSKEWDFKCHALSMGCFKSYFFLEINWQCSCFFDPFFSSNNVLTVSSEFLFLCLKTVTLIHTFILTSEVSVQLSSVAQSCLTLCHPMNRSMLGLPVHHQLLEFTQTHVHESVMPSSHLILCHPLLLLPPIPPSIRVFSNESMLRMRWPKSWSFSFSIIPSKEIPGLISFGMDWLDLLAVQGTVWPHLVGRTIFALIFAEFSECLVLWAT